MQSTHDFMHRRHWLTWLAAAGAGVPAHTFAQTGKEAGGQVSVRLAAASDLQFALLRLTTLFELETGIKTAITFGSSGHLARQLEQGLPMDVFLSADEALIFRLAKNGWARDTGVVYGLGRLAWLVTADSSAKLSADLKGLVSALGESGKLSIANPDHAPYGRAARSALQTAGLWPALQSRLVLGENVSQATQFVSTGAAQVGLVALSLALAPEVALRTRHGLLDASLHPPIVQRMALHAKASASAQRFYVFLQTDAAKKVLAGHGLG